MIKTTAHIIFVVSIFLTETVGVRLFIKRETFINVIEFVTEEKNITLAEHLLEDFWEFFAEYGEAALSFFDMF